MASARNLDFRTAKAFPNKILTKLIDPLPFFCGVVTRQTHLSPTSPIIIQETISRILDSLYFLNPGTYHRKMWHTGIEFFELKPTI